MCSIQADANDPQIGSGHCQSTALLNEKRSQNLSKGIKDRGTSQYVSSIRDEQASDSVQAKCSSNKMKSSRLPALSAHFLAPNLKSQKSRKASPSSLKGAANAWKSALGNRLIIPFLSTCSGWSPREQKISTLPGIGKSCSQGSNSHVHGGEDNVSRDNASANASSKAVDRRGSDANNNSILKTPRTSSSESMSSAGYGRRGKAGKVRRDSKTIKPGKQKYSPQIKESLGNLVEEEDLIEDLGRGSRRESRRDSKIGSRKGSRKDSVTPGRKGSKRGSRKGSEITWRKDSVRSFKKSKTILGQQSSSDRIGFNGKVKESGRELRRRITYVYKGLDNERNGKLTMRHIRVGVLALGLCPSEMEMNSLEDRMIELQKNYDDVTLITLDTFLTVMTSALREYMYPPATQPELQMAFRILDTKGQGYLTEAELREALMREGEPLTEHELTALLEEGIPEDHSELNYAKYVPLMSRTYGDFLPY